MCVIFNTVNFFIAIKLTLYYFNPLSQHVNSTALLSDSFNNCTSWQYTQLVQYNTATICSNVCVFF